MPPLETMGLFQKAVLWAATGRYDGQGKPIVSGPEQVDVDWEDTYQQIRTDTDNVVTIEAIVTVDRDIPLNSIMALGDMDAWGPVGTGTTGSIGNLMQVVRFHKVGDLKNRGYDRVVKLARYGDQLPIMDVT